LGELFLGVPSPAGYFPLFAQVCPDAKVLMLTLHDSLEWVETALHAGDRGYLLKSDTEGELMRALNVVAGDGIYASPALDPDRVNRIVLQLGLIV
jgi:DNA-binding NarL/FixJ family response regulator